MGVFWRIWRAGRCDSSSQGLVYGREDRLYETAQRIKERILDIVRPMERFGLEAYFNYRSASEQAELREAAWE